MQFFTYLKKSSIILIGLTLFTTTIEAQDNPWRLDRTLGLPDWIQISTEHRTRYETLDNQYRAMGNDNPGNGGDQALVFRTLVHARMDFDLIRIGAELEDSRITLADNGSATSSTRLTPTIANPLELLQAYVEIPVSDLFVAGSQSTLRGGRMTMDIGSRRLVARNRFRNTINAFTGADWQWQANDKIIRAFYTLPVFRQVDGNILDNHEKFDEEDTGIRFWGIYYSQPTFKADKGEAFLFGLNEEDTKNQPTRNRELYTFGMRFWREPVAQQIDYQIETVYQLGESRASTTSTTPLDHWAHFHHAEFGYSFDSTWQPRLVVQYDYASGDDNPNDGQNNNFDTLYGARRFDFGPTSTYGAFERSNIQSPALRLFVSPIKQVKSMIAIRGFWRASSNSSWATAGISGQDGFIGTQIETSLQWEPLPGNLALEGGVAHIIAGDLMDEAEKNDTTYGYTQVTVKF